MDPIISARGVSKQYRLGQVGTGTLSHDLNRWWHRVRGKEDPYLKIGDANDRTEKGTSDYVWALRDVDFDVGLGEVLGIIGRNGAGKSTLLKILSRTTAPTTGEIRIKGRVASLLEVGTGFHPELTGRENIFLNGAILGMTKGEILRKFDEIVDFAGVERYIDTPVKRYSSGMYVRLAFGVAAHLESEILVVDEVLAVGDAEFQNKCLGKMKDVSSNEGRTVLFVSHNMGSVNALCTKGLLMENGTISCLGDIGSTIQRYLVNVEKSAKVELAKRTDRTGSGVFRFITTWIEDEHGQTTESLIAGREYHIMATLDKGAAEVVSGNLVLAFAVYDSLGYQITDLSNISSAPNTYLHSIDDRVLVRCRIENLPLNEGSYRYNLYCTFNDDEADAIEHAAYFKVEAGDFFGTGKLPSSNQGKVLFRQSWSIH